MVLLFILQCNCTILNKAENFRIEYDDDSAAAAAAAAADDDDNNGYDTMIVMIITRMINSRQL
jgi:hypothetical protein